MTEAEYHQLQLEEQQQQELEQQQQELEERESRREAFQPSNWWWSRIYVKSDISLEGEEDK